MYFRDEIDDETDDKEEDKEDPILVWKKPKTCLHQLLCMVISSKLFHAIGNKVSRRRYICPYHPHIIHGEFKMVKTRTTHGETYTVRRYLKQKNETEGWKGDIQLDFIIILL